MKSAYRFIVSNIVHGLFFIIPIVLVVVLLGKVFNLLRGLMTAVGLNFSGKTFLHASIKNIIAVTFILLICFLCGRLGKLKIGQKLIDWVERNVLSLLPGYQFMKSAAEDILGVTGHNFREVVILREGESMLLGFKVEDVTPTTAMIFVPIAPEPRSGRILIVDKKRLISTTLKNREAFMLIKGIGVGSGEVLGRYLTDTPPGTDSK